MQLKYRGITYEYTPVQVETVDGKAVGKYRGLEWCFRYIKKPVLTQPTHTLTYRGVKYCNSPFANPIINDSLSIEEKVWT